MRLSAPKKIVFQISLVLVVFGILGQYGVISAIASVSYLLTLVGYVLLAAGAYFKGF